MGQAAAPTTRAVRWSRREGRQDGTDGASSLASCPHHRRRVRRSGAEIVRRFRGTRDGDGRALSPDWLRRAGARRGRLRPGGRSAHEDRQHHHVTHCSIATITAIGYLAMALGQWARPRRRAGQRPLLRPVRRLGADHAAAVGRAGGAGGAGGAGRAGRAGRAGHAKERFTLPGGLLGADIAMHDDRDRALCRAIERLGERAVVAAEGVSSYRTMWRRAAIGTAEATGFINAAGSHPAALITHRPISSKGQSSEGAARQRQGEQRQPWPGASGSENAWGRPSGSW